MTLTDIFSIPFLICLSISILLIGCSSIYFYQKISQQDHKISSMIALISSMAQENQAMHSMIQNRPTAFVQSQPIASKGDDDIHLIHVSDDEDDDTSSEETSSDDSDDENESVNSDSSSSSGSSESPSETGFKINILNSLEETNMNLSNPVFDELSDDDDFEDDDANSSVVSLQDLEVLPEIINISEDIVVEEEKETDKTNIKSIHLEQSNNSLEQITDFSIFKSINILNPDENVDTKTSDAVDYKKMSITKLREIISKQGVTDASKLKKNDILKLLGVEQ
jgi:hypothetical protein